MEQLKRFRIPALTAVGVVVVALVVWLAWISPEGQKKTNLDQQKATLLTQQQALQTQLDTLRAEQRNIKANCATLNKDITEIPTSPGADTFLQQVTQLAQASGDPDTPSYSIGSAAKGPSGVDAITINLSLAGTYGQMTQFLQGLGNFPRLFTISSINIAGGPVITGNQLANASAPNYTVTLTGNIYYAAVGSANICSSATQVAS